MANLRPGDVLASLPYSYFTGGVKWNISCHINKQRHPSPSVREGGGQGSLRQAIVYTHNNKSGKVRAEVAETDPLWSQN